MSSDSWQQLQTAYRKQGLVLALGAGVSIGCGIPGWEKLLVGLAARSLGDRGAEVCRRLFQSGYSFPAVTSILKSSYERPDEFTTLVREELYRDFPFFPEGVEGHHGEFVQFVQRHNPTLRAIAALCASAGDAQGEFRHNSRIHAVMNFNLDCLLRAYDVVRYGDRLFRTIERASAKTVAGRINVYQVHGYLVFNEERFDDAATETSQLTITEHQYYDFFNSPTGLFNYTFLFLLREYSFLFIGMSMRDDNVRRLLHYSTKERLQSDLDEGKSRAEAQRRSTRHFAILRRSDSREIDELAGGSLTSLGTSPLWIDDYDELPDRLAEIYEPVTGKWHDVW